MRIGAKTRIADIMKAYPRLEQKIMSLVPDLKRNKGRDLEETAPLPETVEELAQAANLAVGVVVDELCREAAAVDMMQDHPSAGIGGHEGEPAWIGGTPKHVIDGTAMLERGIHPLEHVNQLAGDLNGQEFLLLTTAFKPMPLIFEMQKQNYQVYSRRLSGNPDQHQTFIRK